MSQQRLSNHVRSQGNVSPRSMAIRLLFWGWAAFGSFVAVTPAQCLELLYFTGYHNGKTFLWSTECTWAGLPLAELPSAGGQVAVVNPKIIFDVSRED